MALNDVLIFNSGGIPLVAKCYGGEYCKMHPDHALITGFLSAINSFGNELGYEELRAIIFDEVKLVFSSRPYLYVTLSIGDKDNPEEYQETAETIIDEFLKKYEEDKILSGNIDEFDEFIEWMDQKYGSPMGDLRPLLKNKKKSLFGKIKSLLW